MPTRSKAVLTEVKQTASGTGRSSALMPTPTNKVPDKTALTAPRQAADDALQAAPLLKSRGSDPDPESRQQRRRKRTRSMGGEGTISSRTRARIRRKPYPRQSTADGDETSSGPGRAYARYHAWQR
ncbi:hypothetical protein PR003_g13157 [Phytophthora rubi]|uniref:Uncharacterized protein n=1 Tax=Phytophthora rubi TaxID=129364 RepID=A0A6A3L587_9STRA|nr:hypothetical protein PR002_g14121 [Phytophthora rubi]KAE9018027.1 hypothetical protein PR001_g14244 [Phytophthora rubi]KAE9335156.1 hypothetical protein PR003_g13157 [Phytophthora rubi]